MRVQLASDIHTEFQKSDQGRKAIQRIAKDSAQDVKAILVPGDLSTTKGLRYAFSLLCDLFENVIYTTGNHEFYKSSKKETEDLLQECCDKHSNLHWLNRSHVVIDEQRFIGTTLWHPATSQVWKYLFAISDTSQIKDYHHWVLEEFELNKEYLNNNLQEGDVLLTHHIPSVKGVHSKYKNNPINCFFVGDISNIIRDKKPAIAVHGHTHEVMEYIIGDTMVYCNPLAYPHESNQFSYSKIIEI